MKPDPDYVAHLVRDSRRFAEAIRAAPSDAQVPSCPAWNADDLLWHLGEVQWFWGTVVREKLSREQAEERKPPRPADRAALLAFFDWVSGDLAQILAVTAPESPAWTWSDDKTVGFIRRRQAHEALIHRIDAELTTSDRTGLDPELCADGVDEALRVMYGALPAWGTFSPDRPRTVRLRATDTGDSWFVTLGRFTGTDPDGVTYDEPDIHAEDPDPGSVAAAEIAGAAADLDCWLWHRPALAPVARSGDPEVLGCFEAAIAPGID